MEGFFVAIFSRPTPPGALRAVKAAGRATAAAAEAAAAVEAARQAAGRGLHSSAFLLNLSGF